MFLSTSITAAIIKQTTRLLDTSIMERWTGKVAVVTGASAGIGAAIAESLVDAGLQVAGIARRKHLVEELAESLSDRPGKLHAIQADMACESEVVDAFEYIKENLGPVHILVNNAGVVKLTTNLSDGDANVWRQTFDVNVLGLCVATREAIRSMKAEEVDGHVVHINSVGGHRIGSVPNVNVYPATKFAVTALAEILTKELADMGSKIKVTSVSPGLVKTEIFSVGGNEEVAALEGVWEDRPCLEAKHIADAVMYVLGTPPEVQIEELIIRPIAGEY